VAAHPWPEPALLRPQPGASRAAPASLALRGRRCASRGADAPGRTLPPSSRQVALNMLHHTYPLPPPTPPHPGPRQLVLKDGTTVEAYEHGMSLSIVALRGSVPTQWVLDFRQGLGK
jgi:hypothetical protein